MSDGFIYEPYNDAYGMPVWSCRRTGAGIVGYGHTRREALEDFLDKEEELLPLPTSREREIEAAIDDHLHEQAFGDRE